MPGFGGSGFGGLGLRGFQDPQEGSVLLGTTYCKVT